MAKEQLLKGESTGVTDTPSGNLIEDTPYQVAFQSSCTPMANKRRYLVWNAVGCVTSRVDDTSSSIEVEFADVTKHRNIRITDHFNFQMAALGEQGVFFASLRYMTSM